MLPPYGVQRSTDWATGPAEPAMKSWWNLIHPEIGRCVKCRHVRHVITAKNDEWIIIVYVWHGHVQYSTKVFGALEPLSRFLAISPKQMQISTPNFQHPLSHQYDTLCENLKVQGIIGRPQMTSEWHNVPSISTPPRTQFLSYDQLT